PDDLDRMAYTGDLPLPERAPVRQVIAALEATYCGRIGFEVYHVESDEERQWLLNTVERTSGQVQLDPETERYMLEKLSAASLLEEFLHRKFLGAKRFSVEGAESLIPMLHTMVESSGEHGVKEIVLGMAHRGRLNVMINLFDKKLEDLFTIFKDDDAEVLLGRGDVKYHLGRSTDVTTRNGNTVHLSLCFNPSHLEFVDPVVLGRVRAKQDRYGDDDGSLCVPLLIHGDAAVIGQGVVAETLNMSQLLGYKVGGTVHIVANNQIGFTTDPSDSRSTRYCTDIAKMLEVPVLHVNAEDINAVVYAAQMAIAYRQRFKRDIFIDLISYRRHGHNEGDEPRFTQPRMYNVIDDKPTIRDLYRNQLIQKGSLTPEQDDALVQTWTRKMEHSLEASVDHAHPAMPSGEGLWSGYKGGLDADVEKVATRVERETLVSILNATTEPPEGFSVHSKLQRLFLNARKRMANGEQPLDWATGEMLAFGTLLHEGVSIRMSGQDSQRGTFSQRHAVITDTQVGQPWTPLQTVAKDATFQVWNSPLSEAGVVGFEYGYSLDTPDGLTIWEAQFGDFVN
ncbi:MAG: thiamine pyrophosphate-dependent enzyme, partial [Myxococcota bacterium]